MDEARNERRLRWFAGRGAGFGCDAGGRMKGTGGRVSWAREGKGEYTDLGTETLKTTWSSEGSSSDSENWDGSRLRFQRGRVYDFVTRRASLEEGTGSGITTQSWSKRTLGLRGVSAK